MKCEHEGCEEEAVPGTSFHRFGGTVTMGFYNLCKHHLAERIRAYSDEVEGVKECDVCAPAGFWKHDECPRCHGTGKVPR